jgi:hypothetical protein
MRPPERAKTEFEKVKVGEFISGVIENIEYEKEHTFKSPTGTKVSAAVRFVFKLDGYQYPHRSRWMSFSYGEKSNLYKNFLNKLILGAMPDMDMDLDVLKGVKVKTIWNEQNDFQFPENIFPVGDKYKLSDLAKEDVQHEEIKSEDEPF